MQEKELKEQFDEICEVLTNMDKKNEIYSFLRDLLSQNEIIEFSNRFEVAKMLDDKISYLKIEGKTGMSSTTIARISKFLNWENLWYKNAIELLKNNQKK